jgi:anti-sigma B factor antagonist
MEDFSLTSVMSGEAIVVAVTGRVDSVTAATMDTELGKIVNENKHVVLDLKDVAYMSSAGVRASVRMLQSAQKAGGGVKLAQVPSHVADVLETVGMMQILEVFSTVDEAVASF